MNYDEYWEAVRSGANVREYDLKLREIQRSLKYNTNPNATVRHHLMDTPEQIEYNKAHYELWGFNEDGTFEYGKYIVFLTKEEHLAIHHQSADTRYKMGSAMRGKRHSEVTKEKMRHKVPHNKGKRTPDSVRKKQSESHKGHHYNKGVTRSDEYKQHMSEIKKRQMEENSCIKLKISDSVKDTIKVVKESYYSYKESGGTMTWNEFQKQYWLNKKKNI